MGRSATWALFIAAMAAAVTALASAADPPAGSAAPPAAASTASQNKASLDTVTVEARRERKELERRVDQFVFTVPVRYLHDSLSRWNRPVCPLVAGLPRAQGEYVLARLSQIATDAKAPLAGEHCQANFYIIVTPQPQQLIRKWQSHDVRAFRNREGMGYMRSFRDVPRPVHVWYNTTLVAYDGKPVTTSDGLAGGLLAGGLDLQLANVPTNVNGGGAGSRLTYSAVRSLSSVIVVVDATRVQALNFVQLADYIGLVGLAEVNQDAEVGQVPSILRVFRDTTDPPQGLSSWDAAFLASLYGVEQGNIVEQPMMKQRMVSSLAAAR